MISKKEYGLEQMSKLHVIIVTFNGIKWIDKCLHSILESTVPSTIIIVDNKSSDETIPYLKKHYPDIILFENKKNLGFGRSNNIGIKYALENNADYIYLLNQDAWVEPNTFEDLINIQKSHPDFGVLSPIQMTASKTKLDDFFATLCIARNKENIISDIYLNKCKEIYEVDFVMAAHWLISKECIINIGGFSSIFTHYGEDNNYLHRCHYHGYKVGICPKVIAVHDREFRKRTPAELFYLKYNSAFLVDLNNINNSIIKSILKAYCNLIFDEIKLMIKTNSIKPLTYIWKSLFILKKTFSNRKLTTKKGTWFLK